MAEMMDRSPLDRDRSAQGPDVMEIIGGLGLLRSLEDAVEAASAALERPWADLESPAEDESSSEGVSPEPEAADMDPAGAPGNENPAEREPEAGVRAEDPPAASPAGDSEEGPPDQNTTSLNEGPPDSQTDPLPETDETSAPGSTEPAADSPTELLADVPSECPTEPLTQPDLEDSTGDGNKGDSVTSEEQVEQVLMSQAEATPCVPGGEETHLKGAAGSVTEGPGEEAQSDDHEEAEEVEEQQENASQDSGHFHEETPAGSGGRKSAGRNNYSKYNTVSYRTIRRGNTRQRIDEFESMIHT